MVDRDGSYVVADAGGALWRLTPAGQLSAIHRGTPFSTFTGPANQTDLITGPRSVAISSAGNYVVMDPASSTIFQVTRSGDVFTMLQA